MIAWILIPIIMIIVIILICLTARKMFIEVDTRTKNTAVPTVKDSVDSRDKFNSKYEAELNRVDYKKMYLQLESSIIDTLNYFGFKDFSISNKVKGFGDTTLLSRENFIARIALLYGIHSEANLVILKFINSNNKLKLEFVNENKETLVLAGDCFFKYLNTGIKEYFIDIYNYYFKDYYLYTAFKKVLESLMQETYDRYKDKASSLDHLPKKKNSQCQYYKSNYEEDVIKTVD